RRRSARSGRVGKSRARNGDPLSMRAHIHGLAKAIAEHYVYTGHKVKEAMDNCDSDEEREGMRKELEFRANVAEAATKCMQACEKAADNDELNKLAPSPISRVAPDSPQRGRAVVRFGSRPLPEAPASDSIAAEIFKHQVMEQ